MVADGLQRVRQIDLSSWHQVCSTSEKDFFAPCGTTTQLFGRFSEQMALSDGVDKDDKPDCDDLAELGPNGVQKFQSVIGAVQWLIVLCQFDVTHTAMSLGLFHCAP